MESWAFYVMIALTAMVFGAEIVASHVTHSLALLVSSYHMLYNLLSLLLLLISHRMTKQKTLKNTFGWARVKVLGMLVNMLLLCALCFAASVECIQTVIHASHENTEPRYPFLLLILGTINLVVNAICFLLIGGYTHHQGCSMIIQRTDVQVNCVVSENFMMQEPVDSEKQVPSQTKNLHPKVSKAHKVMDVWRDTSSSLAAISCACIILLLNGLILKYADAILAATAVVVLLATTHPFIKESGLILLQSIPNNINIESLSARLIKEFPAIQNVHDLHVWRLTASEVIATVHVIFTTPVVYDEISLKLNRFFENEGISLVTIQPEFLKENCTNHNSVCILPCSSNNNCGKLTCCGPMSESETSTPRLRCSGKTKKKEHLEESAPCIDQQHMQQFVQQPMTAETRIYDPHMLRNATESNV